MSLLTGKDGAVRELLSVPAGIGGAVKDLDGMYCGQDGANKLIFGRYRWEKWSTKTEEVEYIKENADRQELEDGTEYIKLYSDVSIVNGSIKLTGTTKSVRFNNQIGNNSVFINYPYYMFSALWGSYIVKVRSVEASSDFKDSVLVNCNTLSIAYKDVQVKGDNLIGIVRSDNQSSYPENGEQDGFWYVRVQ